jgi:hypothetical protein
MDQGHERLYDRLTAEEREVLRDFEAWCWSSQDVSEEEVRSHQEAMTSEAWERIQPVMQARVEASRERQRVLAERTAILRKLEDVLLDLRNQLEP